MAVTIAPKKSRVNVGMRRRALVAAVAACLAFATDVRAHPQFTPSAVNRYIKLDLIAADRVRLVYTLMVGPGPAALERRAVDVNHDGRLSPDESQALGGRARTDAQSSLEISLDGAPVRLDFAKPYVGLSGDAVSDDPFSVDLELVLAPGPGRHRLRVAQRLVGRTVAESEVRITDAPPATHVIAADRGDDAPAKKQLLFQFSGPVRTSLDDRAITVDFEATGPAPTSDAATRTWVLWILWILGGVVLVGVSGWLIGVARRRRPRATATGRGS